MVSTVAGKPVNHEGGRADLLGPGHCQPRCYGDRRSKLWTQEAQGGLPRRKQQVQVWKVSCTDAHSHVMTAQCCHRKPSGSSANEWTYLSQTGGCAP